VNEIDREYYEPDNIKMQDMDAYDDDDYASGMDLKK